MNMFEKLSAVQSTVKATKDAYNSFGKYNYRSCESILEAVKPVLQEYKCSIVLKDDVVQIGERFYIKATAEFIDCENDDKSLSVSSFAREEEIKKGMDGAQITGSSSSYARKYALAGLLLLDDNKDPDATNKHGKDKPDKQNEDVLFPDVNDKITAKEVTMLDGLFALEPDGGKILSTMLLKGRDIKSLTKSEYGEIMSQYTKYKNGKEHIQKRLDDGTKAFALKANLQYDDAKKMIQDSLEIDFNNVQPKDLANVLNQIKEMIDGLGDDEQNTGI